jgi:hypothetical protein
MTMALASATRRAMPPDNSAGSNRAAPRKPTACSLVSTSWRMSGSGNLVCARSGKATFSYTSSSVSNAPFWNNIPMRRRSANNSCPDMVETSSPHTFTLPLSARDCPVMSLSNVVLPVPEGPMNAVMRPRRAVMLSPSNILRPPTEYTTSRTSITASPACAGDAFVEWGVL